MIAEMQKEDLSAVMTLWLEGNLQAHAFMPEGYWQSFYEEVAQQISRAEVYVWKEDGVPAGFIGLTGNYIAGLFVEQKRQRQGIGCALLQFVQQKKEELTLQVYAKNQQAIAFYQKNGFVIVAEQQAENVLEYTMQWHIK